MGQVCVLSKISTFPSWFCIELQTILKISSFASKDQERLTEANAVCSARLNGLIIILYENGQTSVLKMEEATKEEVTDEAFRKCERRGRRGACVSVEIPPTEKLQEMLGNLEISEKQANEPKTDAGNDKGT